MWSKVFPFEGGNVRISSSWNSRLDLSVPSAHCELFGLWRTGRAYYQHLICCPMDRGLGGKAGAKVEALGQGPSKPPKLGKQDVWGSKGRTCIHHAFLLVSAWWGIITWAWGARQVGCEQPQEDLIFIVRQLLFSLLPSFLPFSKGKKIQQQNNRHN